MKKNRRSSKPKAEPRVGIFWLVRDQLVIESVPVSQAEPYDERLTFPASHIDVWKTLIQPGDPPFEYRVQIPTTQPPGLYWYHPHVHGFSEEHLLGGASGAIIVEGTSRVVPAVAGLPERVVIIRDEKMPEVSSDEKPDPNRPTKQLSINFIPVPYPSTQRRSSR